MPVTIDNETAATVDDELEGLAQERRREMLAALRELGDALRARCDRSTAASAPAGVSEAHARADRLWRDALSQQREPRPEPKSVIYRTYTPPEPEPPVRLTDDEIVEAVSIALAELRE